MSEKSPLPEGAEELPKKSTTDFTLALFLATHIDKPCEVEIHPGQKENLRAFYIREAQNFLQAMKDESARDFLQAKIDEYQKKQ